MIVDVYWLAEHLDDPDLVVLEAVTAMVPAAEVRIAGSRRADLEGDWSEPGDLPHTLPTPAAFTTACRAAGINADSHVVVYDPGPVFAGPRVRWMLRAAGHGRVSLLDGGLSAWVAAGGAIEPADAPRAPFAPGTFEAHDFRGVADADEVAAALSEGSVPVVDARSRGRFAGVEPEPRPGLRAGHAPGAVNLPFAELLVDGRLRPADELAAALAAVAAGDGPVIASCGSGVTACVVALAAEAAGRPVQIYDGSWSQWGRPGGGPVATT